MKRYNPAIAIQLLTLLAGIFFLSQVAESEAASDFAGWEKDSQYNSYYNFKERDSLKGKVIKFKQITPLPGMAPGTALILDDGGEEILVHICPWAYADPQKTGIRKDIKTKISGSWATIDGQDVFIAAKVKQGETFEYKVRLTKDGLPFWAMTPEERIKEASAPQE